MYELLLNPCADPLVTFAIEYLTKNVVVRSRNGTMYQGPTCRMSGEMNTSLGNSINNLIIIWSALRVLADEFHCEPDYNAVIVEGDDSLCAIPEGVDT